MISIAGIELSDDLVWYNEFDSPTIAQSVRAYIGDGICIQNTEISTAGRDIILSAIRDGDAFSGYFTRSQIQQLKDIEASGTIVPFIYEDYSTDVIISSGGISVVPLIRRPNQADGDKYTGNITMIEV